MTVRTTNKCWDPYAIVKARDVIKLLSRSVPYQAALRVLNDEIYCDIVKIRSLVSSKEKFVKRRMRLVGPKGATIKALEILTDCFILVQGSTVSIVGHYKQLKVVRRVIEDTMKNIHPVYHIKEMMIKRELAKDEKLKDENWDRFLPNFKKKIHQKKQKKKEKKVKKEYTPYPPEQTKRKEDLLLETGEYFLTKEEAKKGEKKEKDNSAKERLEKKNEKLKIKKERYQEPNIEDEIIKDKERKKGLLGKRSDLENKSGDNDIELQNLKAKFGINSKNLK